MRLPTLLTGTLATLTAAQGPAPYTDPKSGLTFNTFIEPSTGYFFGIQVPTNATSTDFVATIGGKGTAGWSGVSLGGSMLGKLLIIAWPNGKDILSSFRKTASYGSPAVATGTFAMAPIANGTYVNSTHWTYTFTCSKCIQSDGTTFQAGDPAPIIGWAYNAKSPSQIASASSAVSKHSAQGQTMFGEAKKAVVEREFAA